MLREIDDCENERGIRKDLGKEKIFGVTVATFPENEVSLILPFPSETWNTAPVVVIWFLVFSYPHSAMEEPGRKAVG
ncbi:unnamed protein product [Allacma fusca]|uniref:Uncharacterized protein n=1 Tax=Allacma fusca TaxID=39272 RepID=A0A8J2KDI5_9HEXA|nr:unnamed protein product [Allacma fusca]